MESIAVIVVIDDDIHRFLIFDENHRTWSHGRAVERGGTARDESNGWTDARRDAERGARSARHDVEREFIERWYVTLRARIDDVTG